MAVSPCLPASVLGTTRVCKWQAGAACQAGCPLCRQAWPRVHLSSCHHGLPFGPQSVTSERPCLVCTLGVLRSVLRDASTISGAGCLPGPWSRVRQASLHLLLRPSGSLVSRQGTPIFWWVLAFVAIHFLASILQCFKQAVLSCCKTEWHSQTLLRSHVPGFCSEQREVAGRPCHPLFL